MYRFYVSILFLATVIFLGSCDKDDDDMEYDYTVHIHAPDSTDKHVGDSIHIHVHFESPSGETIHNVNVSIYKKDDPSVIIYSQPDNAHIHAEGGSHELHDDFILSVENGVDEHTNWVLEAKVWGHEDHDDDDHDHDEEEDDIIMETVEFHVHP